MENESYPDSERTSLTTVLGRFIFTIAAILVILYIGLLVISRTDGFRQLVKEHLRDTLCPQIEIHSVFVNHRLHLEINGFSAFCQSIEGTMCGVKVDHIKLYLRPTLRPMIGLEIDRIEAEGADIDYVVDSNGDLHPALMAPLSVLIGDLAKWETVDGAAAKATRTAKPDAAATLTTVLEKGIDWTITDSTVEWRLQSGALLEEASELELAVRPIEISTGIASYIYIKCGKRAGKTSPANTVELEAIRLGDSRYRIINGQ
jgi:hypothetical protein